MRIIPVLSVCGVLAALAAGPARAVDPKAFEVKTNAELVALCAVPMSDRDYEKAIHFCHGFGIGFFRYHEAMKEGKDFKPLFCVPESVTRNRAVASYVKFSKAHPEYDQDAPANVVLKFLVETYPCSTN